MRASTRVAAVLLSAILAGMWLSSRDELPVSGTAAARGTDSPGAPQAAEPLRQRSPMESSTAESIEQGIERSARRNAGRSPERSVGSTAVPSDDPRAPQADDGDHIAELVRTMEESGYARMGETYVDYFVASGLSPSDSERVVRQGIHDASLCSIDAMREEALAQSVPFDTVLYALEAALHDADGPLLTAVLDMQAVRVRETPCLLNVFQEAGLIYPVAEQLAR